MYGSADWGGYPDERDGGAIGDVALERVPNYLRSESNLQPMIVTTSTTGLRLRDAPSTSGAVLTEIPKGASVRAAPSSTFGWHEVEYGGLRGFASSQYLSSAPRAAVPLPPAPPLPNLVPPSPAPAPPKPSGLELASTGSPDLKKYALIGGGALLAIGLGWWFLSD